MSAVHQQNWRQYWAIDPTMTFLNHGSFGACPIAVLDKQQKLRRQMESEPVRFFAMELEGLLDEARSALATFVGGNPASLAFVPNATTGVNTVLRSLPLQPGDELLTTDHEYNASRNALNVAAERAGATVVVAQVPFPMQSGDEFIAAVLEKVTPRTRLVLVDHVTSQTALVLPVEQLVRKLAERGIEVLIDGAHAPGMVLLDLDAMGVAYYTGNCHKWMCAPKGAAFLYVRQDLRSHVRPLVISHGANSTRSDRSFFHLEFDWTGTGDPTPYLCVPEAIQFMGALLPGGWPELMQQNREKALTMRNRLARLLQVERPCPDALIGAMAVLPLPNGSNEALQNRLFHDFQIEVPIVPWHGLPNRWIRISAQIYNQPADYDVLAEALVTALAEEQASGVQ